MENKNYAKLVNNIIEYSPRKFIENNTIIVPRINDDDFYFARGYFKVIDQKPSYDSNTQIISFNKWELDEINHIKSIKIKAFYYL